MDRHEQAGRWWFAAAMSATLHAALAAGLSLSALSARHDPARLQWASGGTQAKPVKIFLAEPHPAKTEAQTPPPSAPEVMVEPVEKVRDVSISEVTEATPLQRPASDRAGQVQVSLRDTEHRPEANEPARAQARMARALPAEPAKDGVDVEPSPINPVASPAPVEEPEPVSTPPAKPPIAAAQAPSPGGTTREPAPAATIAPRYPPASIRRGEQGVVMIAARVDAWGEIIEARIVDSSGHARLDRAALEAVRRTRFRPALRDGDPVTSWVRIPVRFALR